MRVLIQRVKKASVTVEGKVIGTVGHGLLLFLGMRKKDDRSQVDYLVEKVVNLRIFEDGEGKMNDSLIRTKGQLLVVSQFTLYGKCEKGRRPSFTEAMSPEEAAKLYEAFIVKGKEFLGKRNVVTGKFGAEMSVSLVNDGPVTFLLDR